MTTQYTPTLKLALPVTGELSGTWGDVVNDNITSMIEQAIAGLSTINTWTSNAHTLTTASGTTSESRCAMLVAATGGGAPTAAAQIICPAAAKLYVLQNNTSFAVTLKTSAGTGVAVAAGDTAFLFCDSTNVNSCVTTIVDGHITGNLTVDGNTTLGNATSDTITATARFNTDLIPSTDNARDLGSSANSWKDLYIDGTATIATLNVTTIDTTNLEVTNIKAKDGTAAIVLADVTGVATIAAAPVMTALTASKPVFTDASKALTSSGTLAYDQGGTGQTSYAAGDIVYANATNTLAKLTIGSSGQRLVVAAGLPSWATDATVGTVTSVAQSFTGGIVSVAGSPITTSGTLALTVAGTSGGVPYFSSGTTWATSAALAASALVIGGGAGAAPSTTTTGTGVVTALGVNVGTAGAFVVNGGALGTPASGTVTNLTGTASININGTVGATTATTGAFTTLSATGDATITKSLPALVLQPNAGTYSNIQMRGNATLALGLDILAGAQAAYFSADTLTFRNAAQSANYGVFSSTGLAVTGTLSSTLGATIQGLTVGLGAGAVAGNTAVGVSALAANSTGARLTAVGASAGAVNTASDNAFVGYNAGTSNTSGINNTALGSQALYTNISGGNNTAIGYTALLLNTGSNNTAVGGGPYPYATLGNNSSGAANTAIGTSALAQNTTASNNTAVGYQAGYSNVTGTNQAFIGYQAGYSITGNYNTAIGNSAGYNTTSGTWNTFLGVNAGPNSGLASTGSYNVAIGGTALQNMNGAAASNTAVGYQSLYTNQTASDNTAVGYRAGYENTTGAQNVYVGPSSGFYNQTGTENTFVGFSANGNGTGGSAGSGNTAVGRAAMNNNYGSYNTAVGNGALQLNASASNNTALGYQAGYTNVTGANNTYFGYAAGYGSTGELNTFIGNFCGYSMTTGTKNTILGRFNGNQGGLNIAAASNYIVLSDGDGNPLISTADNQTVALEGAVPNSGTGITFPATQSASSNANTLDDYEEGTWTPAFVSTGATFAYAEQYGSYVKIGNLVTLQMHLRTSSVTGTTTNATNVTGIPFASANLNADNDSAGAIGLCDVSGGLAMTIANNQPIIYLWNFGVVAQPTALSISGKYLLATITYRTA